MWQRLRDQCITWKTRRAIVDRECQHDGAGRECSSCINDSTAEDRCGW